MRIRHLICITFLVLAITGSNYVSAQENRSVDTRIADLLARMPARDAAGTTLLMTEMLSLGEAGIKMICNQVIPAGSGDDVRPRFAVESLSRFLSEKGISGERQTWEQICIGFVMAHEDYTVKDFFMKQLQLVGGNASVSAVKPYLYDPDLCAPAIAVMSEVGGSEAEKILAGTLKDPDLPCAASVMNVLADMGSGMAINEYISWSASEDNHVRASAYRALAVTGNQAALPVLQKAAKAAGYKWEHSGATSSLLDFASAAGEKGDLRLMEKVCKLLIDNCDDRLNIQYKSGALNTLVRYTDIKGLPAIMKALEHNDRTYRNAALRLSLQLKEGTVTQSLISAFGKSRPEVKPEIIRNLGERRDTAAAGMIESLLFSSERNLRIEAAAALVSLRGSESVPSLIEYLKRSDDENDQAAARSALKTVLNGESVNNLIPAMQDAKPAGLRSIIELLAWSSNHEFFAVVFPYTGYSDEKISSAAFNTLQYLAGPENQKELLDLLEITSSASRIADLQAALSAAANKVPETEKRDDIILKHLNASSHKERIIPVLAMVGGTEALSAVLKEFENGSVEMRTVCFRTISSWKDYTASSALFEICASRNKTYESQAFEGYVRQVKSAPVADDQRLLLFRRIMPYALDADRKNTIITELGRIKTYPSLFFTSAYLDDPLTSAAAAKAVMYIALPGTDSKNGMSGRMVRDILTRAVPRLSGPESEYDRELVRKYIETMPPDEGFVPMFNGKDLSGWQGLVENPVKRAAMKPAELAAKQAEANKRMLLNWSVKDGVILFNGKGDNLCSVKEYADFEMFADWKISKDGDSGIYLRGSPQVQIWDTSRTDAGAQVGSGGLYNNQKNPSKPLKVADNPVGDWNTFRIIMIGEKVSVWLNGILVVDDVVMENYWDRSVPIFPKGPIELQAHGNELMFRDIFVREIDEKAFNLTQEEKEEGFVALFNGRNLDNWTGDKVSYIVEAGEIVIKPQKGSGGNLFTKKEFSDFVFRFEFQLTPGANNGLGIRAPLAGNAAYLGMEIQIIDDSDPIWAKIQPFQYHGSIYGVVPAKKGYLKPVGDWNYEEVIAKGTQIKVILNDNVIVDADISGPAKEGTVDRADHPGLLNRSGHIGFLGHGSVVRFRNIRIKELK